MDQELFKLICALKAEKAKLDVVIAALEQLEAARSQPTLSKKRGRPSMAAEERKQVSTRMKKYWADQKGQTDHHA